jgi:hypothetical protein
MPFILGPTDTARAKSLGTWRALDGSCFQYSSRIRDVELPAPASLLRVGKKTKKAIGGDPPDRRLSGRTIGLVRSPVAGSPFLCGLKHRVVAAPETLSTAYRTEQ